MWVVKMSHTTPLQPVEDGHAAGASGIAFSVSGEGLLTCGSDCEVRFMPADSTSVSVGPAQWTCELDESINAISVSPDGTCFVVGLEDGHVQLYALRDGAFKRNVTKNTLAVHDLAFSPSGTQM